MQESIVETLKNMKSEQNLTLQQISSASGVPLSTVNRILSGQTENPSFRDVAAIVAAIDGWRARWVRSPAYKSWRAKTASCWIPT